MDIIGKVVKVDMLISGETDNGPWCRQTLIIEPANSNGKRMAVDFSNENTKLLEGLKEGELVNVGFAIDSTEYKEKWYTHLRGFTVIKMQQ